MATFEIVPNGDVTTEWGVIPPGFHYNAINEDHTSPDDDDGISAVNIGGDDNDIDGFNFEDSPVSINEATRVVVWTRGDIIGDTTPEIDLYVGSWQGYEECVLPVYDNAGWTSNTFDGSWSEAEIDALQIRYRADCPVEKTGNNIYTVYIVVTYIPLVSGWSHKIQGIANANIAKISGVAKANIAKVNGV